MNIFQTLESEVRSYCRGWPTTFDRATGSLLYDENGKEYLDFFAGAGSLNYGHNNPLLKRAVLDYIERDGITHSLDMNTVAERALLESLQDIVLKPRDLDYKVMFPGPAGEAASNIFVVFNSVDNVLQAPFAAPAPRPPFVASRDFTPLSRSPGCNGSHALCYRCHVLISLSRIAVTC